MENHGGRVVIDASGNRTEHRIHTSGKLEGLGKEEREAAIAAAHGYDAKPGLRFNLLHGPNLWPAQRKQLLAMPEDDRNAVLDLGDVAEIGARLKELAKGPADEPAEPKGDES